MCRREPEGHMNQYNWGLQTHATWPHQIPKCSANTVCDMHQFPVVPWPHSAPACVQAQCNGYVECLPGAKCLVRRIGAFRLMYICLSHSSGSPESITIIYIQSPDGHHVPTDSQYQCSEVLENCLHPQMPAETGQLYFRISVLLVCTVSQHMHGW